jgi:hypothetical protein
VVSPKRGRRRVSHSWRHENLNHPPEAWHLLASSAAVPLRRAEEDGNASTPADPEWLPLLETRPGQQPRFFIPPIPDYPSIAATESAAAAAALASELGDAIAFAVTSTTLAGVTRRFSSFSQAAREAGRSRVFGGIHFLHAVEDGLDAGGKIGREVSRALPRSPGPKR